jgi:membrane protein YqaA with SNARE-associated domain
LDTIKRILSRYTKWLWALLAPLGPWGVFVIAAVDAAFFGLPMDAVVAGYVYKQPSKFFLYVILAAAGSAVGSIVLYLIGYTGGEVLLRKRLSAERFGRIHASFEKHEFWALMFPAMLPPPTPFKLFVLAAAAFEMRFSHFLAAIFAGRFVRFLILALLTLKFGPQFVEMTGSLFRHHLRLVLLVVAAGLLAWLWRWRRPTKANGLPGPVGERDNDETKK